MLLAVVLFPCQDQEADFYFLGVGSIMGQNCSQLLIATTPLLLLQDDQDWHRGDSDKYETEGEGELYEFGQECLDRLSLSLGGNTVAPLASLMFQPLMASQVNIQGSTIKA
jgi:hypothetical protein